MRNNIIFFLILNESVDDPIGNQQIDFHIVFDDHIYFHRKSHCVSGGH